MWRAECMRSGCSTLLLRWKPLAARDPICMWFIRKTYREPKDKKSMTRFWVSWTSRHIHSRAKGRCTKQCTRVLSTHPLEKSWTNSIDRTIVDSINCWIGTMFGDYIDRVWARACATSSSFLLILINDLLYYMNAMMMLDVPGMILGRKESWRRQASYGRSGHIT